VTMAKQWSGEAVEAVLAVQDIMLATGRGVRLVRAVQPLVDAMAQDPQRDALELDDEPAGFLFALRRCKGE
jgi:hypothetical protein